MPVRSRTPLRLLLLAAPAILGACLSAPTDPTRLAAPTGLTVSQVTTTSVLARWDSVPGATGYIIQRAVGANDFVPAYATSTLTRFTDTVTTGLVYLYRVRGVVGSDTTTATNPVSTQTAIQRVVISSNITASRTLTSDTVYTIRGYVKVANGATLTILPGTRIEGDFNVLGSSLWIQRGARLVAEGTADRPIVFTSSQPVGQRRAGDWGGIVMVGNARVNRTENPLNTEGGAAGQAENYGGGTNDADNSGSLRYVRIEFAGFDIASGAGQELNGLSMYALGNGTRIQYVQTVTGLDDSFEWWGGTVDVANLISYESGDDHFDWTEGWRGRAQFLIAFQTQAIQPRPGAGIFATDPRGIEADGCDPTVAGTTCVVNLTTTSAPFSNPVIGNFTLVGTGDVSGFPNDGNGVVLRRGTAGTLIDGIIARFPGIGLDIRDAFTDSLRLRDSLNIANILLAENGRNLPRTHYNGDGLDGPPTAEGSRRFAQAAKFAGQNHRTRDDAAALFTSLFATGLDWTPANPSGVNARTGGSGGTGVVPARLANRTANFPYNGGWQRTAYVGAGDPAGGAARWWLPWSVYAIN
ncbi:MAG: fibronectin type III domain-containing protein [Gemmatimonadales bacterium]|nr:fibronectin type III domain-containing protein [Gemmatimonadales bacterium]